MRPEAVRKALKECAEGSAVLHLIDGRRIPIRSREHRMMGHSFLYVLVEGFLHDVAYFEIASIVRRRDRRGRRSRST